MTIKPVWMNHADSILRGALLFIVLATLAATLWPFNPFPANHVAWQMNDSGLRFGSHGLMLSTAPFSEVASRNSSSCSFEAWLEPSNIDGSSTILDFYHAPEFTDFSLRQEADSLYILRGVPEDRAYLRKSAIWIDQAFAAGKTSHVVITCGANGTSVYVNGRQMAHTSDFGLVPGDISGWLIFGESLVRNNGWSGVLRGLAIYDRELTQPEISRDYSAWTEAARPAHESHTIALFRFDERTGTIAHNQVRGPDLVIPAHYRLIRHSFLTVPWREFFPNWEYVRDIVVNILGFMPLGFLLCAYLSLLRKSDHATLKTMVLCALISLIIETLQAFLPTRTSGLTDVITNSIGGLFGALVCETGLTQELFRAVGLSRSSQNNSSC
jgi:VanZ like protein/concanavalin A-like lectin/glucanase superfamily protein